MLKTLREPLGRRPEIAAARSLRSHLAVLGFAALVGWVAFGPLDAFFRLKWPVPFAGFLILAVAAAFNLLSDSRKWPPVVDNVAVATLNLGVYFYCCSLVLGSQTPAGSAVFSSFLVFSAASHGYFFRSTLSFPLVPVLVLLAMAASFALWPTPHALPALLVSTATAVVGGTLVGTYAEMADRDRREREQLHQTIAAQALASEAREREQLNERLINVLGEQHDIRNKVATALLNAEALSHMSREDEVFSEIVEDITDALMHTKSLIEESSREQRALASTSKRTPADMVHAFNEAAEQIGRAFPQTKIIIDDELGGRLIRLAGGQATADRIATNLVLNACQGDGNRGANVVNIHLLASRSDATVLVSDDGPGFPEAMLNEPLRAFNSSKAEGTGLGLFTVDRLVQASAGLLELRGSPTGGAELELRLPLAPAATTDEKPSHQRDPGPG